MRRFTSLATRWLLCLGTVATTLSTGAQTMTTAPDPYLWLEEVQGERALAWAQERNKQSQALL